MLVGTSIMAAAFRRGRSEPVVATVANTANTTVTDEGDGVYLIEKTSGADLTWDAAANSIESYAGNFVLKIEAVEIFAVSGSATAGVSTSTASDGLAIGCGIYFWGDGNVYRNAGGANAATLGTWVDGDVWWLVRTSGSIAIIQGGATPDAGVLRATVSFPGTVYFDCSISRVGAGLRASMVSA